MALPRVEHDLHRRRLGRNIGLGAVLLAFVALVFGLTLVKTQRGDFATNPPVAADAAPQSGGGN